MNPSPLRILHVVAGMTRGGLETWLMNVMRRIDRRRFQFDFCVSTDKPCDYDDEIRALGGRVLPCLWGRNVWRFDRILKGIIREGSYDVVHAHPYNFAGFILRVAAKARVRHRFAHLHTTSDGRPTTLPRILYRRLMLGMVRRHATRVFACSQGALTAFFGSGWQNDQRMHVVYYGVNLDPFADPADRLGFRAELGLPENAALIIHVGRFVEAKNHKRLVEIFQALRGLHKDVHLVLVGDGELLPHIRVQVGDCGLSNCVHFLGVRADVARLMKAADVMLMPSVREGMPLTMIEAAAAGLPVVIADMPGTREANDVGCRARLVPLERPSAMWAEAVAKFLSAPRPDAPESLERMRRSPFAGEASARTMESFYADCVRRDL